MATSKEKLRFRIKRSIDFIKIFTRNRRGVLGVAILILFAVVAIFAPLISSYDPVYDWYLSGDVSAPVWFTQLPGGGQLSKNYVPFGETFSTSSSLPSYGNSSRFIFEASEGTTAQHVSLQYNSSVGDTTPGSTSIIFERGNDTDPLGNVKVNLKTNFTYPYGGPPTRFAFRVSTLIQGTGIYYESWQGNFTYLDVQTQIRVFIERVGGEPYDLSVIGLNSSEIQFIGPRYYLFDNTRLPKPPNDKILPVNITWAPSYGLDSYNTEVTYTMYNPKKPDEIAPIVPWEEIIFPKEGNYTYGIEIVFKDNKPNSGYLRSDAASGQKDVAVTSASIFSVGDLVMIKDENAWEYNEVSAVDIFQGTLTMVNNLSNTYKVTADGKVWKEVKSIVYIDDIRARFFGNAFGLLGTDQYGRDIFTQLIYGARISLYVGLLSAILSVLIGLIFGLSSGFLGGIVDEIMMRFNDMLLVLPGLPLLLVLMVVLGQSVNNLIILIGVLGWMGFARVVRSQVLSLKERPFIEAARAVGAGKFHIIVRHVLPNVMSLVYVTLATSVPGAILLEAAISWLGWYDPSKMSWGRMLHDVQTSPEAVMKWWWVLPPGLCIAAISLSFILLGFALDDVLNPKLRKRR